MADNHAYVAKISYFGGSECYVVIARDETDARNLISKHHRIVTANESAEIVAVWPDNVSVATDIDLSKRGAYAPIASAWGFLV